MEEFFERNLSGLKKKNLVLAGILENFKIDLENENIGIELKNNKKSLFYLRNNHKYFLHSIYNKSEEAEVKTSIINFEKTKVIFAIGIGEGHHIKKIQEKMSKDCTLIIIEPDLNLFFYAIKHFDLSSNISNEQTYFLASNYSNFELDLMNILYKVLKKISSFEIYFLQSTYNLFDKEYEKIKELLYTKIIYVRKTIGNSPIDTLEGLEHMIINSYYSIESDSIIDNEKTGFEDVPIISVASGPSLNKNIHLLKQMEDKALIICSDSAYESLLKEGIKPHIVTIVERGKNVYDYLFVNRTIPKDITLVTEALIYPEIFNCFEGKKVTVFRENMFIEKWIGDAVGGTKLVIGPSVANLNIAIAKKLKPKCLILVGQDLAYSESGSSHAKGTAHENNTIENDLEKGNNIEYVEGISGKLIKTTKIWKYFLEWINNDISNLNIPVIDATEGGAKIDNSIIMSLEETINKYCINKFDIKEKLKDVLIESSSKEKLNKIHEFKKQINKEKGKLDEIHKIILKNTERLDNFPIRKTFNENLINKKVNPINSNIHEIANKYPIFYQIVQSTFINLGNFNSRLSYIDENNINEWKEEHLEFFLALQIYSNIYNKILKSADNIVEEMEKIYER